MKCHPSAKTFDKKPVPISGAHDEIIIKNDVIMRCCLYARRKIVHHKIKLLHCILFTSELAI